MTRLAILLLGSLPIVAVGYFNPLFAEGEPYFVAFAVVIVVSLAGIALAPALQRWFLLMFVLNVGALLLWRYATLGERAVLAKTQADIRAIASGLSIYLSHCGGLPPAGAAPHANCPTAAGPGGPSEFPSALLTAQRNRRNEVKGPFFSSSPSLARGFKGTGPGYSYSVVSPTEFVLCARSRGYGRVFIAPSDAAASAICP